MASYNFSWFGYSVSQTHHFETNLHDFNILHCITRVSEKVQTHKHTGSAELSEEIYISSGEEIILSDSANQTRSADI